MFDQLSSGALGVLVNITNNLQPWWTPIKLCGYFMGFVMIIMSVVDLGTQEVSMMRRKIAVAKPVIGVVSGLLLINLLPFMDMLSMTFFGEGSAKTLSYGVSQGDSIQKVMLYFSLTVTILVGLAGLIRGVYMIKHSSDDPRQFWPAMTHIGGGLFAVNICLFFQMLGATVGGDIGSSISKIVQ